jgi:spermidine/putrescine transport system substrate-binding protein
VWKWAIGAPETELWMDTYTIPVGAPNPDAAHAWINWILTPEIAVKDMAFHGYNPGLKDVGGLVAEFAPDLTRGDMIFFPQDVLKTMKTQKINEMQNRQVDILNKAKAAAGA